MEMLVSISILSRKPKKQSRIGSMIVANANSNSHEPVAIHLQIWYVR